MSTQVPDGEAILETARNDPETVDLETVVALFDADQGQVRNIALRCAHFVANDDPGRIAAVSDHIIERLDDEFAVAGSTAAAVLASIAPEYPDAVRPAVPALVGKLDEHPPQTGYRAARALTPLLEDDPAEFVSEADALLDVVVDPPEVWAPEPDELRDLPQKKRDSITNLLASRRDEIMTDEARVRVIREFAAHALVEVTALEPDAIADRLEDITPALSRGPPLARAATIDVVANVAKKEPAAAAPAIEALIDLLEDNEEFVRTHAVRALGFAEATDAVEPLRAVAEDADGELGELAADTADWVAETS